MQTIHPTKRYSVAELMKVSTGSPAKAMRLDEILTVIMMDCWSLQIEGEF